MTLEEIKKRVAFIEAIKADDEGAHSEEDDLYEDFVKHVASCGANPLDLLDLQEMAKEVLKTKEIDFARWCA